MHTHVYCILISWIVNKLDKMLRTNLRTDGVGQQCLGAYLAVIVKKVFVHALFIRNRNVVLASQQHITGEELKLWPVAERHAKRKHSGQD